MSYSEDSLQMYAAKRLHDACVILDLHWDKWIPAPNGCFIWCAAHDEAGYGVLGHVHARGKNSRVHRMVCEATHGLRAPFLKLEASHLCDEPRCVRPEHLVWETRKENDARIPTHRRYPPPRGLRGKNSPPFTVVKSNPTRPYWVRVTVGGIRHTVGYFETPEEAIAARSTFLETRNDQT